MKCRRYQETYQELNHNAADNDDSHLYRSKVFVLSKHCECSDSMYTVVLCWINKHEHWSELRNITTGEVWIWDQIWIESRFI
jgi:hypothetical protein